MKRVPAGERIDISAGGVFVEHLVKVVRTTKVVKGGRRFRYGAFVVVGNKEGVVGIGYGKANEVSDAIKKGTESAKRNLISVPLHNGTIPHELKGRYCASKVWISPASVGTGIIAGGSVRAVLEYAGIRNVLSKVHGSRNPINVCKATFDCLRSIIGNNVVGVANRVALSGVES